MGTTGVANRDLILTVTHQRARQIANERADVLTRLAHGASSLVLIVGSILVALAGINRLVGACHCGDGVAIGGVVGDRFVGRLVTSHLVVFGHCAPSLLANSKILETRSVAVAPLSIQRFAASTSMWNFDGSFLGEYQPMISRNRPSRATRESAATIR
jgi:hypothetical protein